MLYLETFLRVYLSDLDNTTKKVIDDMLEENNEYKETPE